MALSDRFIRAIKPESKHQFIADGSGLYLRVHPTGAKTWVYRSRLGGRARWVTLGTYPTLSLLEARRKALEMTGAQLPDTVTFGTAYQEYYDRVVAKRYLTPRQVSRRIETDVLPFLRTRPLNGITQTDLVKLLHEIVDRGAPVQANRTLADIKHIFAYATERGWLKDSPAERITRRVAGGPEQARSRALSFDEIRSFISRLVWDESSLRVQLALGMLILTGQRSGEIRGMNAGEITGVWWSIPAERMNKSKRANPEGKPHKVYLGPSARALWKLAIREFGPTPFNGHDGLMSEAVKRLQKGVSEESRFTPHDLRRTLATRLSDLGVAPHVIEKMLAHQMTGVMSVYNRAEYLDECRAAWRLWGRELTRLRRSAPAP